MSLFAALRVHSGETHAMTSQTGNRFDLIRFLDEIDDTVPPAKGQQIIAIMDNLSTHATNVLDEGRDLDAEALRQARDRPNARIALPAAI